MPQAPIEMQNALQRVFNTYELLECILSFVDMKTLLLSQRVSHKFNEIINKSLLLQRKLFFQPSPAPSRSPDGSLSQPALNPLLYGRSFLISANASANLVGWTWPRITVQFKDGIIRYGEAAECAGSWRRMLLVERGSDVRKMGAILMGKPDEAAEETDLFVNRLELTGDETFQAWIDMLIDLGDDDLTDWRIQSTSVTDATTIPEDRSVPNSV